MPDVLKNCLWIQSFESHPTWQSYSQILTRTDGPRQYLRQDTLPEERARWRPPPRQIRDFSRHICENMFRKSCKQVPRSVAGSCGLIQDTHLMKKTRRSTLTPVNPDGGLKYSNLSPTGFGWEQTWWDLHSIPSKVQSSSETFVCLNARSSSESRPNSTAVKSLFIQTQLPTLYTVVSTLSKPRSAIYWHPRYATRR